MLAVSLTRKTISTDVALKRLMHERLRTEIWSRWSFLFTGDFSTWWCNWSTVANWSVISRKVLVYWASCMSAGIQSVTERASSSIVVNHAVSVSFASQSILIISTVTANHVVLLLCLLDKIVILGRIESSSTLYSAWWVSNLCFLISCWNLIILILNHALHIFCNNVIFADHGLLLVWLLAIHCSTFTTERICLLSALRMLVRILKVSVESVGMWATSHT